MAEFTGSELYVKFGTTVLDGRYRTFEPNEEVGLVDQSGGADTAATYLKTRDDGGATLEILAEAGGTALWAAVDKGAGGTLEWAPEGTTGGNPKHTVVAIVRSRRKSIVHDDVVKISVDFQFSGAVSDTSY